MPPQFFMDLSSENTRQFTGFHFPETWSPLRFTLAPFPDCLFSESGHNSAFGESEYGSQAAALSEIPKAAHMETVLIVDDDPIILDGVADVLRCEEYCILATSTGLQAIQVASQSGHFSLLLSDIGLQDISGTEVALALHGLDPHLPVLFMSGYAIADWSRQDRSNFKRLGTDLVDFLEKPFSALELKMRVQKLIRASRPTGKGSQAA